MSKIRHLSDITPVMSATPDYSANDVIGVPMLIATEFFQSFSQFKRLVRTFVQDKAAVGPSFSIYFFNAVPAGGTYTDNTALVLSVADQASCCGKVSVLAADFTLAGGSKFASPDRQQPVIVGPGTGSLWAIFVADGAYNGATVADLVVDLDFES